MLEVRTTFGFAWTSGLLSVDLHLLWAKGWGMLSLRRCIVWLWDNWLCIVILDLWQLSRGSGQHYDCLLISGGSCRMYMYTVFLPSSSFMWPSSLLWLYTNHHIVWSARWVFLGKSIWTWVPRKPISLDKQCHIYICIFSLDHQYKNMLQNEIVLVKNLKFLLFGLRLASKCCRHISS